MKTETFSNNLTNIKVVMVQRRRTEGEAVCLNDEPNTALRVSHSRGAHQISRAEPDLTSASEAFISGFAHLANK